MAMSGLLDRRQPQSHSFRKRNLPKVNTDSQLSFRFMQHAPTAGLLLDRLP
jgi:hypothetical protein